jgi:branched-chain amino acid transport system substrate-binding protein
MDPPHHHLNHALSQLELGGTSMGNVLRRTAAAAVVAGLLAGVGGCGPLRPGRDPAPVVIAADLALTGSGSGLGTVYQRALELRVEQLSRQDTLGGRRLELRVRDNRSDPRVAEANLAEFAADPAVTAIVAGACGPCAVAAADALAAHRVPAISLAPDDQVANPVAERRYLFKLGPNAGDGADLLAAALAADRVATVGLVTVAGDYGEAGLRELTAAAGRDGFAIVIHRQLAATGPDRVAAAASAIAGWRPDPGPVAPAGTGRAEPDPGPDAVVIWTPDPVARQLAADLRRAGYRGRLHLDAIAAGELHLTGDALAGASLVFTDTPVADQVIAVSPARAARHTWFRDYVARHGTYHAQSSWAADAVGVIVDAVRRLDRASAGAAARPVDRVALRDQIESIRRLDGLTGLIRFTADQHSGLHPESLTTLVAGGGRWHLAR